MNSITHFARFHVPPDQVFRVLGASDYLSQWWMREAQLGADCGAAARSEAMFRNVDVRVRFDDCRPPASVRWKTVPVASTIPGWDATTIKFDLRASTSGTFLALTHGGFEEADEYDRIATGWARCLLGLQRHLEAGNGMNRATWETNTFLPAGNPSRPLTLAIDR